VSNGNRAFREVTPATKFWLLLVQQGEGCDYTVGCGVAAHALRAQDVETARVEAKAHMAYGSYLDGHHTLEHVVLVKDCEFLPLSIWKSEKAAKTARDVAEAQRARDEAEFEALKRKLGK
jgi:hypothetical protein